MMHEPPIPVSPAPGGNSIGSLPWADEKRKIAKTETGILCSENNLFQLISSNVKQKI
jgi:hypothetical protein